MGTDAQCWKLGKPPAPGVGPVGSKKDGIPRAQHRWCRLAIQLVVFPGVILLILPLLGALAHAAPDQFATQVLADAPIGYWRFNEASLSDGARDRSGRLNNGTYSTTGITLGQLAPAGGDPAALFDGSNGRVIVRNSDTLNPSHITMEAKVAWFGPKSGPPLQQRILEKSSFTELAQYGLSITALGHVRVELRTSSATTSADVESIASVARDVETHVVATYDGQSIRIYLNGLLDREFAAPGSISPKPPTPDNLIESGLGIGNQTQRDRPFNGIIDEVALYNNALSADKIRVHYQSQFGAQASTFQYAAKFVCQTDIEGTSAATSTVLPGAYRTVVNIHNPNREAIPFRKKIAVPGQVSEFFKDKLGPDQMLSIDCTQILKDFGIRFIHGAEGFLVIESALSLDVVAVYTAGTRAPDNAVHSIAVERVEERKLPAP